MAYHAVLSPKGQQAPINMPNYDYSTGTIYPPGEAAPINSDQVSVMDEADEGPMNLQMLLKMRDMIDGMIQAQIAKRAGPAAPWMGKGGGIDTSMIGQSAPIPRPGGGIGQGMGMGGGMMGGM